MNLNLILKKKLKKNLLHKYLNLKNQKKKLKFFLNRLKKNKLKFNKKLKLNKKKKKY